MAGEVVSCSSHRCYLLTDCLSFSTFRSLLQKQNRVFPFGRNMLNQVSDRFLLLEKLAQHYTISNRRKILAVTTQLKQLRKESLRLSFRNCLSCVVTARIFLLFDLSSAVQICFIYLHSTILYLRFLQTLYRTQFHKAS